MKIKDLESVSILGLGLLGGSLGLAISRVFPDVRRVGFSHREITRRKALESGVVDKVFPTAAQAVEKSQLVVLASPIGTFADLMEEMSSHLPRGCIVTDVGSTKVLPQRWARKYLPRNVEFLGSHPMAGSEQRGVEFARDDLFYGAYCVLTPTPKTKKSTTKLLVDFWRSLGMLVDQMSPARHDRVVGRISHLPHVLAMTLMNVSDSKELLLCGKGFLDTTRIASGPPGVWHDILMGNAENTAGAIEKIIKELGEVKKALRSSDGKAIVKKLSSAQSKRNDLIAKKIQRKELPE